MRVAKWLYLAQEALQNKFVDALVMTIYADGDVDISKEMSLAVRVAKMHSAELGLTPEYFIDRTGEQIKQTVLQRRIEMLNKLIREEL
jgi:hypothetical protein